jgi:hypothetical protein
MSVPPRPWFASRQKFWSILFAYLAAVRFPRSKPSKMGYHPDMVLDIGRRRFVPLRGGAASAWPFDARAQHAGKVPTIGLQHDCGR